VEAAGPAPARRAAWLLEDPVRFAGGVLGLDLWAGQKAILRAVARHPRVAVKACHASGKTLVAAVAGLWWLSRWPDAKVITTAPTWTQVERLLWAEVHRLVARSGLARWRLNQTSLVAGPGRFMLGLSTNESGRFQGFHAGRVLVIVDEAPGVRAAIFEAIEGIRAGGRVHVLMLGNPVAPSGPFYEAFARPDTGWKTITISAFDTPNLRGPDGTLTVEDLERMAAGCPEELDRAVRPYLTTRRWVWERWREWGERHPLWQARVLGRFPEQSTTALYPLAWLEDARQRPAEDPGGQVFVGIDVAGPGEDETALCVRCGPSILLIRAWQDHDPRGAVLATLMPFRERLGPGSVRVDEVGLGYYFMRHLRDVLGAEVVVGVNVGAAPRDPDRFVNRKAEVYWAFREWLAEGRVAGLTDAVTYAQAAEVQYRHDPRGRVVIEGKDDVRRRTGRSPDRLEALVLAFADVSGPVSRGGLVGTVTRSLPLTGRPQRPGPEPGAGSGAGP
jgi:phage terminase large subunit